MKTFVISLGGSIIFPGNRGPDSAFLKRFRKLILSEANKGNRFVIITGGGFVNRLYNEALGRIIRTDDETLDLLGIAATRMNAFFVKSMFQERAYGDVMENPTKKIKTDKRIIIGCGWKPGCSSDKDAVLAARTFRAKKVINLTNIDYVYTKDPRKHKDARKIGKMMWKDFRKIVGDRWSPKLNAPFDPMAAKLAEKLKLKVVIAKGNDLDNLKRILQGKAFRGTTIG